MSWLRFSRRHPILFIMIGGVPNGKKEKNEIAEEKIIFKTARKIRINRCAIHIYSCFWKRRLNDK
ncbi:hypothetical protein GCM10010954_06500 [Halobacillus andaensis]|uniref:Uncharacterized protein n=1 Tax=Halobacillus andaensis TaxID=1176239 RepID=A0A917AYH3_HALAA|nr:hypothetical protein GCM10010954_06500 [Halobacillus andaensis]